jgi:hypothetical protein
MKKTYQEILDFTVASKTYNARLNSQLKEGEKPNENKLTYSIGRVTKAILKRCASLEEARDIKQQDANIDFASVYPPDYEKAEMRGNLVVVNDQYQYTPENDKKRREAHRAAQRELLAEVVEFESYYATQLPEDLTDWEREAFVGFVIREDHSFDEATGEISAGPGNVALEDSGNGSHKQLAAH